MRSCSPQSQQRLHELEALYRADETLHSSLRLEDVLEALVDVAQEVLGADKTSVYAWDADLEQLVPQRCAATTPRRGGWRWYQRRTSSSPRCCTRTS